MPPTLRPFSATQTGGYGPEYQKVSGGGPKFRDFLERELIPWVDREYRTVPGDRTLVGHSYGGLFSSWVLVTKPELFQRYVVVSPSLWYDDHLVSGLEERYAASHRRLSARVYLCVGSREGDHRDMVGDLEGR
jgi:predicted alpha/beta superfamily hydrolase